MHDDTIAALATPLGEGGLAVVRVSGPTAFAVVDRCFTPRGATSHRPSEAPGHTVQFGRLVHAGRTIDEVLIAVLRAPRTYTREDTVEISCHGGLVQAKAVLDTVLAAGARAARPGEFTLRAFLNGRLDLAQAEAVADVIHARTELALAAAHHQLAGRLSARINRLRDDLLHTLAHVEAHLDFPEDDLAPATRAQLEARLTEALRFMDELLRTADEGQVLRRGLRAAIVGRPNVGKSSLLNQLLGHDRAIVSPLPGTTRDTIEETASIRGLPVVFVDTAGLRAAEDALEQEGMRRTRSALARAELILLVLDRSEPLTAEDTHLIAEVQSRRRIVVLHKADLPPRWAEPPDAAAPAVAVSSLTGEGVEALKDAIQHAVWRGELGAETLEVTINARHQDALRRAREATDATLGALRQGLSLELVAVDLRLAVNAVGEIVGHTATEDLLDSIFSQFCIGK